MRGLGCNTEESGVLPHPCVPCVCVHTVSVKCLAPAGMGWSAVFLPADRMPAAGMAPVQPPPPRFPGPGQITSPDRKTAESPRPRCSARSTQVAATLRSSWNKQLRVQFMQHASCQVASLPSSSLGKTKRNSALTEREPCPERGRR